MPNELLDLYRQQTDDPRSDEELISEWAVKIPEALNRPDFKADYDSLLARQAQEEASARDLLKPTKGEYVKQAVGTGIRSVANIVPSTLESIGIGGAALSKLSGGDVAVGEGDVTKAEDRATYQLGQYLRQKVADWTPKPLPELEDSFLATKVPAGLGSAAAFVAGGVAGKALKIPAWISTATLGAASSGVDFYKDAKSKGADDKEAYLSYLFGNIVGTSEAVPLANMVNRLDKLSGNTFSKTLIEAGKETFEEALQEAAQQFAQNYTAKKLYDKDRELLDGVAENASVGGVTGFLFSLLTHAVGKHVGSSGTSDPIASKTTPNSADSGQAQPSPAESPVPELPKEMETYLQKPDGTQPTPFELEQLNSLAKMDAAGELPIQGQQLIQNLDAGSKAAYELLKARAEADSTPAESNTAPSVASPEVSTPSALPAASVSAPVATVEEAPVVAPAVEPAAPVVPISPQPVAAAASPTPVQTATPAENPSYVVPFTPLASQTLLDDIRQDRAAPIAGKERAFFDVPEALGSKYSGMLGEKLTELGYEQNRSLTRQVTFFSAPDGKIYGLAVAKTPSKTGDLNYRVTPDPFRPVRAVGRASETGTNLKDLMARGWTPIASMERQTPVHYVDRGQTVVFDTRADFDAFRSQAIGKLDASLNNAQSSLTALAKQTAYAGGDENEIVQIDEADPATILANNEGFSQDEALAIWPAITGAKQDEIAGALKKAARIPEARAALQLMIKALIENNAISNENEAASAVLLILSEAKDFAAGDRQAFAESLTRLLGEAVLAGNERAAAANGTASNPARADAGTGGAGRPAQAPISSRAEVVAAKRLSQAGGKSDPSVRLHTGGLDQTYRASTSQAAGAFQDTVLAAANNGTDVTLLQQESVAMAREFGVASPSDHRIALVMGNVHAPTADNLYHLNAEIAHTVFADLPEGDRAALQDAVRAVTDEFLGVSQGFQIAPGVTNVEAVVQEERLVDAVARKMVAEGFNPAESQSLAQRFWRALKDLLLRAGLAFGKSFGFSPERSASIATEYLQNRVESFLTGQISPMSFIDFMGGPRVQPKDRSKFFSQTAGYSSVNFRFNPETASIHVQEALPDSVDGLLFNATNPTIRYHTGPNDRSPEARLSPDAGSEVVTYDIAANNELDRNLGQMFQVWDASGANKLATGQPAFDLNSFKAWVLDGKIGLPQETIQGFAEKATSLGIPVPNTSTSLSSLNEDAQRNASSIVYGLLSKLNGLLTKRYDDASLETSGEPGSEQRLYQRTAMSVNTLTAKFDDTDAVIDEVKQNILGLNRYLRTDINRISSLSHKRGILAEMINSVEGKFDATIGGAYSQALNQIAKKLSDSPDYQTNFVNLLAKIAEMPVYFGESDAATIKDWITSATDPDFKPLQQNTTESRALLAVATSFAKRNALMMNMMAIRRASKTDELSREKTTINEAIKIAMGSHRQASTDALRHIDKLETLKERGTRIIQELDKLRGQQETLLRSLDAHRKFMGFYEGNQKLLAQQMATYEKTLGAVTTFFEPYPNAEMLVPETPNSTPDLVEKNKKYYQPNRDGTADDELKKQIKQMSDWLDAHPVGDPNHGSALYNRLLRQVEKLKENSIEGDATKGSRNLVTAAFGPMTEKLETTGVPELKQFARMLRGFESNHLSHKQDEQTWATNWTNAAVKARKALGYSNQQMDVFLKTYYNPSFDFVSRRLDLQVAGTSTEESVNLGLNAIRARYPALTDAQWGALESLLRESVNVSDQILKTSEKMGNRIYDEKLGIYRTTRGAKLFELMRHYSPAVRSVFSKMGGEPNAPGLWAREPFNFEQMAQEIQADPNAARAKYAAYFQGEVWDVFAAPLANRSGRSAFHAPDDGSGIRNLARTTDVKAAFAAAPKGDVFAFASNLFDLSGAANTAGAKEAFVVDTLHTFQNWYKGRVSAMAQEQSRLAENSGTNIGQALMTARTTDEDPAEWVEYAQFDLQSVRSIMQQLTLHASFGRNLETAKELVTKADNDLKKSEDIYQTQIVSPLMEIPGQVAQGKKFRKLAQERADALGLDLQMLEKASQHRATLGYEYGNFTSWVKSQGGIPAEFKWWSQLMSAFVSWTVQGPKTALIDTNSFFKPIQEIGLSTQSIGWVGQMAKQSTLQNVGGFLEIFGKTIKVEADKIRMLHEFGQYPSNDQFTWRERMAAQALGSPLDPAAGPVQRVLRQVGLAATGVQQVLNSSLPSATKEADRQFLRIKPAVFTQASQSMHLGAVASTWTTFEDMVGRAAAWINNPSRFQEREDPTFGFDESHAKALGYGDKFFGLLKDEKAFGSLLALLKQNGLTLEELAKDYQKRGMTGPVMNDTAYRKLMVIGPSVLTQESSIISRPGWMLASPWARAAMPLAGWSLAQTASLIRTGKSEISGEYAGFKRLLWKMAPIIGVGLMYATLADLWDEDVLKKKTNRLTFSGDNAAVAFLDKMALSGTFGIVGDFANSALNKVTAREFTIDSRVFFVSSATGMVKAMGDWYHQGFHATYNSVGRPMLQAMGGGGALQYLQAFNGITGADNAEARATARVNVNNWLRVEGRNLDLNVRSGRGGEFIPTRTTPWVRDMVLASYANDYAGFSDAYRGAIAAAREDKRENPSEYIRRAWSSQHPLRTVFATTIGESDYRRILNDLPSNGKADVAEAVGLFNRYGSALGIDPFIGQKSKRSGLSREQLIGRQAGALLGF